MELNKNVLFQAIEQIAKNNLLSNKEVEDIIKDSIFKTFYSKFDQDAQLELIIDSKKDKFELINHSKYVVEDDEFQQEYKSIEISLSEAKKLKEDAKAGDIISQEVDFKNFAKKHSSQVRQLITQLVREKKKEAIYIKHKSLKGEMVDAVVTSSTKSYVIFELEDGTTAFMPSKLRNLNIPLKIGEKVKVYVEDVLQESKESQIVVSNGSTTMIKRLLESEVPEIFEGIIEIVNISRVAGERSKIAVKTNNPEVDPVGAIIGSNGSRINTIIKKIEGEKIDIILWSPNLNTFIANSLSPAKVISVIDKKNEQGEIIEGYKIAITPNKHQTLAIGKKGSNAKLSVKLTNTRIDIISIDEAKEKGIEIIWNGNIDENELENIEKGIRWQNPTRNNYNSRKNTSFINKDLDIDMSSFAESIGMEDNKEESEIADSMFSEEELKQMEENFELDSELLEFTEEDFKQDE